MTLPTLQAMAEALGVPIVESSYADKMEYHIAIGRKKPSPPSRPDAKSPKAD